MNHHPPQVDPSGLVRACHAMASKLRIPPEQVIEYETAKVMEAAVKFTPVASIAKIREAADSASMTAQPESLYTPRTPAGRAARERAFRTAKKGLLVYWLDHRYPDALWRSIKRARAANLKAALASRGLSKRTWLELARLIGFDIKAPGFVKKAKPSVGEGKFAANFTLRRAAGQSGRMSLTLTNAQPTIVKLRGGAILQRAITGRVKYFETSLRKGVFDDLVQVARRYPGIRIL